MLIQSYVGIRTGVFRPKITKFLRNEGPPSGTQHPSGSATVRRYISLSLDSNSVHGGSRDEARLRMIMFGRPGAGKGTLTGRLVDKYDIVSISTGDLLRQHISQKTEIGRKAEETVMRGDLLPDDLMLQVVTSKLDHLRGRHWILDGVPRTIGQGELLDAHLRSIHMPLTLLTILDVPLPILRARIAGRFVHLSSGRVYNLHFNPPRVPGLDDITSEPLVQRPDDRPEVYEHRLQAYERATVPLLGYYCNKARVAANAGTGAGLRILELRGETSDELWPILEKAIREGFSSVRTHAEVAAAQVQTQAQARRGVASTKTAALLPADAENHGSIRTNDSVGCHVPLSTK